MATDCDIHNPGKTIVATCDFLRHQFPKNFVLGGVTVASALVTVHDILTGEAMPVG